MAEESTLRNESIADGAGSSTVRTKSGAGKRSVGTVVALLFFIAFAAFVLLNVHIVQVDGTSMLPTLKDGQRLTMSNAYWLVGPIRDNDIVVIRDPGKTGTIIKRVYKMAGETVDYGNSPKDWSLAKGKYVVPEGMIYVLGDNREHSEDSRFFGPKPLTEVLGKVIRKP